MPLRDPVFNPPFNIVRASHVELGVADLAKSRAFYVDCLGYIVSDEDKDALYLRGVEERNHHSVVLRKSNDIAALAIGFKVGSEEDLDKAAEWLDRAQAAGVVAERAVPGAHAAHRRSGRHAGRSLFQDGSRALDAAEVRRLPGRAHPAHRPHQLLHAGRAGLLRLLHRARLPPDRDDRDRRRGSEALGRVDAAQGQHPRPRLHQRHAARACTTSACGIRTRSTSCTPAT